MAQKKRKLWILPILIFVLMFLALSIFFQPRSDRVVSPTQEKAAPQSLEEKKIRGVYVASVANINFPSRQGLDEKSLSAELDAIVESAKSVGFDTIYFQVRPSSDALYDSKVFPSSRFVTGTEGEKLPLDCLRYLVDKAAGYGIKVVAWVNPYRVTTAKKSTKEEALLTLSDKNPAKQNPELTVFYDGRLYYNPCLERVRDLIVSGVRELAEGYEVAGVLYDDYFYPYPVEGETFEDSAQYAGAESPLSLGDWRREQVNTMIRQSYEAVKEADETLAFGVSPFGIWKNASSDPQGSQTFGLEAYHSLYCDALAWIDGGYVDYISPQIYWESGYEIADFEILAAWWSEKVKNTGVALVISHAAYKAATFTDGGEEIARQIRYAEGFEGSFGSIQYGFADIQKNTAGLKDALQAVFLEDYADFV